MGDMLTAEARTKARWAYVNATFLAQTSDLASLATMCSLYPCLQTYKVAISGNQRQEVLVGSDTVLIEFEERGLDEIKNIAGLESLRQTKAISGEQPYSYNFTAIKASCQVDSEVPNTKMDLHDFTADQYMKETIQSPEHCIFRQDPRFVKSLGSLMTNNIFNGYCMTYKNLYCGVEGDG